jgi:hypothetical protein
MRQSQQGKGREHARGAAEGLPAVVDGIAQVEPTSSGCADGCGFGPPLQPAARAGVARAIGAAEQLLLGGG